MRYYKTLLKLTPIIICIFFWGYRLNKINHLIQTEYLYDFKVYYDPAVTIIQGKPDNALIIKSTYGPPITILPFLPFAYLPLIPAQYLFTLTNILAYIATFYGVWKKYKSSITSFFWIYLTVLAFSFPLIFSLGMGNPIGFVTLGIYALWIFKNQLLAWPLLLVAILLKLFPITTLPSLIHNQKINQFSIDIPLLRKCIISAILIGISSWTILPKNIWGQYRQFSQGLYQSLSHQISTDWYNQSFATTLTRFNIPTSSFTTPYWIFATILIVVVLIYSIKRIQQRQFHSLETTILYISFFLLIHPFPWQHYYALFLPFIMLKIANQKYIYIPIFLLLSINGNIIPVSGVFKALFNSSQFLATLLIFLTLLTKKLPSK